MSAISAVIITRDEEAYISRCISSVIKHVDEVLVLDSGSQDKTCEIAVALGAKVINYGWYGYGTNKNFGNSMADHDWILSIDADEVIGPGLAKIIDSIVLQEENVYEMKRVNIYKGKRVRYGALHPRFKIRLFNKVSCRWDDKEVHEELIFSSPVRKQRLGGEILHYLANSKEDLLNRADHFAELSSIQWKKEGKDPGWWKLKLAPGYHFIKSYLIQAGILEGFSGWEVSEVQAFMAQKKVEYFFH